MVRATLDEYWRTGDTRFDVITIWHVLEHLRDPATAVQQMKDLLNDSGRLVIAVPTSDGKLFRLAMLLKRYCGTPYLLNELFYFHNPNMHFWYPSARALRILLEQSGFEVQSSETMEAFDWTTIWRRVQSPLFRLLLRLAGPFLKWSRFTASENLIMTGRKRP
jgi:2-polyprenyl-3-methyl-5-hydroxy-6-metoxy-1,4-benzoquinol methylase